MKATELAKAFNEIDDAYLAELDTSEKELITMKNRKRISRILIAAAVICLLTVTAFAAEQVRVHSFTNRGQEYQDSYEALEQAIEKAGFKLNLPEEFSSGFRFKDVRTGSTSGAMEVPISMKENLPSGVIHFREAKACSSTASAPKEM